jgi:hypothetical protein
MNDILKDHLFWMRVSSLVTAWLASSPVKEHRRCWIDDMVPSALRRTNPAAEVRGIAWVMEQHGGEFSFLALIPWRIANGDRIMIELDCIAIDLERKTLEVVLRRKAQKPNKAPEPTSGLVTSCADRCSEPMTERKAQLAPSPAVARATIY